ncbi:MAG: hypothetical protein HQM10_12810 [Candidatus Riflebacteria bacterium]|nr:hypothetical protein [Candidatus Riflebacteria bacterium]
MKKLLFCLFIAFAATLIAAPDPNVDLSKTSMNVKEDLEKKLVALDLGIDPKASAAEIYSKITSYVEKYIPDPKYPDDKLSLETIKQCLLAAKNGDYCIGALIANEKGEILVAGHNSQKSKNRSDYHGEMFVMNEFESNKNFDSYRKNLVYDKNLTLYSSAEPCPMCTIRLITTELNSKFVASSDDDGMTSRIQHLPRIWRDNSTRSTREKANCSPALSSVAHILFYLSVFDAFRDKNSEGK